MFLENVDDPEAIEFAAKNKQDSKKIFYVHKFISINSNLN